MTRNAFGGSVSDYVVSLYTLGSSKLAAFTAATLTFFDAETGGNQVTDLALNADGSSPVTQVSVPATGDVPTFYGPDGVTQLWVSANGSASRVKMVSLEAAAAAVTGAQAAASEAAGHAADAAGSASDAQAAAATATAPTDTTMASKINTAGSATRVALDTAIESGAIARGGVADGTGYVNVLGPTERVNISPQGSAFMLNHASDLTATTPHDLVDTKLRSTGDAFYVMHLGGKAPGYNGNVGNGGVGGMAAFNAMIPWHKDDENGGGRAGTVPNDRTGQVGLTIDCQVPFPGSSPASIHSWADQAALFILNQDSVSGVRADASCGTTSGSATVTDTHCTAGDVGMSVTGTGIPAGSYVGTVNPGVSFTLSSSPTTNAPVNATATGTTTLTLNWPAGQGLAFQISEYGNGGDSVQFTRKVAHAAGKTGAMLRLVNEAEAGSPALAINNNAGYQFSIDHGGKLDWLNDTQLSRSGSKQLTSTGGLFIAPTGDMAGQSLNVVYPAAPGNVFAAIVFNNLSTTNSKILNIQQQGNSVFVIDTAGIPQWANSAAAQTTVGAAGGAAALPATPTKYLKVKDSSGTTYVVPAYAAV